MLGEQVVILLSGYSFSAQHGECVANSALLDLCVKDHGKGRQMPVLSGILLRKFSSVPLGFAPLGFER